MEIFETFFIVKLFALLGWSESGPGSCNWIFARSTTIGLRAGREVREKGKIISRITGLDPAGPFYDGTVSLRGLSASDASFVDVIHTNPGRMGIDESVGTVDFWSNCGSRVQPGCEATGIMGFSKRHSCSHDRCWKYFAAAIECPFAFKAILAKNCRARNAGAGNNQTIYMGDKINVKARGNFYLRTNSAPPYGLGKNDCTAYPTK
ncbi:unnamed protein product [Euphydryas editha]|uniref:Lipase domain-containing protein n=1 Tax=Euphydryas editha TaxID=104508 RepID=A0AAU9VCL9_EUPED|nr:unnamed protein product [Euphydryas editha]